MIILELISPEQRTIEQKYLLTTQKKSQLLKKRRPNIVTALLPARDQLQKQQKKPTFGQLTQQKHKEYKNLTPKKHEEYKNLTPHIFID